MNDITGLLPQPERRLITTRREYLDGLALVVGLARRELVIFDPDLAAIDMNTAERIEQLGAFLAASRDARLRIVVHDADAVRRGCPRLLSLLALHANAIAIHQTEGEAARAQDCFALADAEHFVRRGVATQARGAIGVNDQREGRQMHERFEEIWQSSILAISAKTIGL
jgi:hypothetical protein